MFVLSLKTPFLLLLAIWVSCQQATTQSNASAPSSPEPEWTSLDTTGKTIRTRFIPPLGYQRETPLEGTFSHFLQNFSLHPHGHPVHLFNGELKYNQQVHSAVLNIDVGNRDLQQCADAVMRLRGEYLYGQGAYNQIQFHFVNGFLADFNTWSSGNRISIQGNSVSWKPDPRSTRSYSSFRRYMNTVFGYASTLSLEKEMEPRALPNIEIGDVFIQGGSPGHAVLVVDVAFHPQTQDKIFLLAQSYMPAQEIHILKNLQNPGISPWYSLMEIDSVIQTPEWKFTSQDLKHF